MHTPPEIYTQKVDEVLERAKNKNHLTLSDAINTAQEITSAMEELYFSIFNYCMFLDTNLEYDKNSAEEHSSIKQCINRIFIADPSKEKNSLQYFLRRHLKERLSSYTDLKKSLSLESPKAKISIGIINLEHGKLLNSLDNLFPPSNQHLYVTHEELISYNTYAINIMRDLFKLLATQVDKNFLIVSETTIQKVLDADRPDHDENIKILAHPLLFIYNILIGSLARNYTKTFTEISAKPNYPDNIMNSIAIYNANVQNINNLINNVKFDFKKFDTFLDILDGEGSSKLPENMLKKLYSGMESIVYKIIADFYRIHDLQIQLECSKPNLFLLDYAPTNLHFSHKQKQSVKPKFIDEEKSSSLSDEQLQFSSPDPVFESMIAEKIESKNISSSLTESDTNSASISPPETIPSPKIRISRRASCPQNILFEHKINDESSPRRLSSPQILPINTSEPFLVSKSVYALLEIPYNKEKLSKSEFKKILSALSDNDNASVGTPVSRSSGGSHKVFTLSKRLLPQNYSLRDMEELRNMGTTVNFHGNDKKNKLEDRQNFFLKSLKRLGKETIDSFAIYEPRKTFGI